MLYSSLVMLAFALAGLSVGSFLNLCIDRLPLRQSIINPPSHCPACQQKIAAFDATKGNNMTKSPDSTSDNTAKGGTVGGKKYAPTGAEYNMTAGDKAGYILRAHDKTADSSATTLVNYMGQDTTKYWYSCTADGTVSQYLDSAGTNPGTR